MTAEPRQIGESWYVQASPTLMLEFALLREQRDGMTAEVAAVEPDTGASYWARVTLPSAASRATFIKGLGQAGLDLPAPGAFDRACSAVVAKDREGTPAEPLVAAPPGQEQWVVPGWIPRAETTVIYGDGDMVKSLFCLGLAVAGLTGLPLGSLPHTPPTPWVVAPITAALYLDWETTKETHQARLWGLTRPLDVEVRGILYRRVDRPLTDVLPAIRGEIARHGVDLVVLDSVGVASGAEPESADAALRTFAAMRQLGATTRLAIGHVSKLGADLPPGMDARPFGSVHVRNQPRSTILCTSADDGDELDSRTITYKQTKSNLGSRQRPTALRWAFDPAGYILPVRHEPDPARMSISARVINALKGGARETEALSDEIGVSSDALRRELSRLRNRGTVVSITEAAGGRGRKQQWGLVDRNRGTPE